MKVTIITVCFNAEKTIEDTFKSIQSQKYSNIEYIVVDGNSNDRTSEIALRYKDIVSVLISEHDEGLYDAMNKGVDIASGELIGILNADDFYPNDHVISDVVQQVLLNPDVDMVLGNVDFVCDDLSKSTRSYSSFNFEPWKLRFGFMPPHPGAFIKKSAYKCVGKYKLGYKSGADFDMFVRMFLVHKLSFIKLNKSLVSMRIGGVSTSGFKSYIITTQEILLALKENQVYSNIVMVLLRLPIKFFQLFYVKNK